MSYVTVTADGTNASVDLTIDNEGGWDGACSACEWTVSADYGRAVDCRDAIESAGIHLDYRHE